MKKICPRQFGSFIFYSCIWYCIGGAIMIISSQNTVGFFTSIEVEHFTPEVYYWKQSSDTLILFWISLQRTIYFACSCGTWDLGSGCTCPARQVDNLTKIGWQTNGQKKSLTSTYRHIDINYGMPKKIFLDGLLLEVSSYLPPFKWWCIPRQIFACAMIPEWSYGEVSQPEWERRWCFINAYCLKTFSGQMLWCFSCFALWCVQVWHLPRLQLVIMWRLLKSVWNSTWKNPVWRVFITMKWKCNIQWTT